MPPPTHKPSYGTIKAEILKVYFEGCLRMGFASQQPHAQAIGYAVYQYENVYESQTDTLFFLVVVIGLSGGWYPQDTAGYCLEAQRILKSRSAEQNAAEMEREDAEEFLSDLQEIGLENWSAPEATLNK
jgi:hypothetical protein